MDRRSSPVVIAVAIFSWVGAALATNGRETWDRDLYFTIVPPLIGVCAFVLGALVPERAGRWAVAPFVGQAATAIVIACFGVAGCVPAFIGATIGRRLRGGSPG